ncbi:acyltransferase family protein [uncultured Anaerococcus sp.]|uniref:acyltransferase family protein n=1 Tax=uncultured Anaerococcus sp. TaxID=293428 RepID=UPI00261445E1|nr:acyltransferase family protein [uncultured Anaerococcus sp.]
MKVKGLDYLRIYGIGIILIYHLFKNILPAGFLGVNIMFVLSGFLVSYHLLDEIYKKDGLDLKTYYKKRFVRIFPGLFFMVFVISLMAFFINKDFTVNYFDQFLASISFNSNIYEILSGGSYESQFISHLFLHTWFLALEVHFYLLWPLVMKIIYKISQGERDAFSKRFLLMSGTYYLLSLGFTIGLTLLNKDRSFVYFSDFTRSASFFAGSFLACFVKRYGFRRLPFRQLSIFSGILILIMSIFLSYDNDLTYLAGFFITDMLTCLVILAAVPNKRMQEPEIIGKIASYTNPIYLFHWPIFVIMESVFEKPLALLLTVILTVIFVLINNQIFEPFFRGEVIDLKAYNVNPAGGLRIAFLISFILISFISARSLSLASDNMISLEKQMWLGALDQDLGKIAKDKKDLDRKLIEEENPQKALEDKDLKVTVIADSVLLGNRQYIEETIKNTSVDAEKCRLLETGADIIESYKKAGSLGDIVVMALGTNAKADPVDSLENIIDALPKGTRLILVSCYDNRYDQPHRVSLAMQKMVKKYDFITYMPWEELAMDHPEYYKGTDGVHYYGIMDAYDAYNSLLEKAILEASKKEGKK